ncbi:MAG TPA: TolC family protein [Kofleriaceae bacterium]
MMLRVLLCTALLAVPAYAQPAQPAPPAPAPAKPAPAAGELTMQLAVEIAMKQQPVLRQSRAQLEAARGRVDLVEASRRPQISLSAGVSASGGGGAFNPAPGEPTRDFLDPNGGASVGASASWRIYDFGQTAAQLRAANLNAQATAAGTTTTSLDVVSRVELSFLEAVARARLVTVADATVKSEEQHLDQAKRFVAAQAKDPIEVVQAQARAANAKASLAQAQSNAAIALANLRASIGWVDPSQKIIVAQTWPASPDTPPALVSLVDIARKQRPEIVQADREIAAAEANIDAARAGKRPVLSASARTDWSPQTGDNLPQPAWSVGVNLSWLLYDGGRTSADVRIARANRESALAERDALLLDLTSELDATRAQIEANQAATQASQEAVIAAGAQLKLAEARYAQGLGSQIELADAQTAVTTAQGNLIQAEWQLANAWTNLRRALGTR